MRLIKPVFIIVLGLFCALNFCGCGSKNATNLQNSQSPSQMANFSAQTPFLSSAAQDFSSLPKNPLLTLFGEINDDDPLKLGAFPTPPNNATKPFNDPRPENSPSPLSSVNAAFPDIFDRTSDFMVIMAPNGITLTIWATAPGNWLWGYSLAGSPNLGGLRVWRFIFLPDDEVMILNFATKTTCVNTYKNGVIHSPCNDKNPYQKFQLRPMTNGAVQFFNRATSTCLQTPINDLFEGDDFGAINLSNVCGDSIDTQWYLLTPPLKSSLFN